MMLFWVSMVLNLVRKYSVNCLPNIYFSLILNQQNLDFVQDGNPPLRILAIPACLWTQVTSTLCWPMSCRQKSTESFWNIFSFLIKKRESWNHDPFTLPPVFVFLFCFVFSLLASVISTVLATTLWLWGSKHKNESQHTHTHTHTHTNSWVERKGKVCIL